MGHVDFSSIFNSVYGHNVYLLLILIFYTRQRQSQIWVKCKFIESQVLFKKYNDEEFNNTLTNFKMKMLKNSSNTAKLNDSSVLFIVTNMCMYTRVQTSGNIKILGTQE